MHLGNFNKRYIIVIQCQKYFTLYYLLYTCTCIYVLHKMMYIKGFHNCPIVMYWLLVRKRDWLIECVTISNLQCLRKNDRHCLQGYLMYNKTVSGLKKDIIASSLLIAIFKIGQNVSHQPWKMEKTLRLSPEKC